MRHLNGTVKSGDPEDVLLSILLGYADWRKRDPATCFRTWVSAKTLIDAVRLTETAVGWVVLRTALSRGRAHLWARWPGWGIEHKLKTRGVAKGLSFYRVCRGAVAPPGVDKLMDKAAKMYSLLLPVWTAERSEL